jgi:outer membrane protein assembly factor BamB
MRAPTGIASTWHQIAGGIAWAVAISALPACAGVGSGGPPAAGITAHAPASPGHAPNANPVDQNGNDWPSYGRDPQNTRNNLYQTAITPSNVASLALKWTQKTHGAFSTPIVMNGVVYEADFGGYLFAWSLANGSQLWSFNVPVKGNSFISTPDYYKGTLYVGDVGFQGAPPSFYAINALSGKPAWSYLQSGDPNYIGFQGSPLVANGVVYQGEASSSEGTGTCDSHHQLVAFSLYSPTILASLNITPPGQGLGGPDIWASPMVDPSGDLYAATGNLCSSPKGGWPYANAIMSLQQNGPRFTIPWVYSPDNPYNDTDFGSTPLFVNNMLIEGGKDGYVYALNPANGALIWKTYIGPIVGSPATDGTRVYFPVVGPYNSNCFGHVGSICGGFYALTLANGAIAWSVPAHEDAQDEAALSAPAVSQGIVFAAFDQTIWAFDGPTGNVLWSYATGQTIYGGITLVNGGLLVESAYSSAFYCFTPNGQ